MNKLIFDIGATNTKFALISTDGEILAKENVLSINETVDGLKAKLRKAEEHNGKIKEDVHVLKARIKVLSQQVRNQRL